MAATKRDWDGGFLKKKTAPVSLKPWIDFGQIENLITDYDTAYRYPSKTGKPICHTPEVGKYNHSYIMPNPLKPYIFTLSTFLSKKMHNS